MRRIRIIGLTLVAVLGLAAIAASSALASAAGPQFLLGSGTFPASVTTTNLGDFTLHDTASGAPEVLCTGLSAPSTLSEGAPGKSVTEIQFSGCTASGSGGSGACDTNSKGNTGGNITVPADDELVYTGTKKEEAEKEEGPLGDLFTPLAGGSTFVTLTFEPLGSGKCPSLAVGEIKVNGSVIGKVEPVNTFSTEGMLTFPKSAILKGYKWLSQGSVEEVKPTLKSFGGTSTQLGLADLKLTAGGTWGAFTS